MQASTGHCEVEHVVVGSGASSESAMLLTGVLSETGQLDFQKVQRTRAKKATTWLERPTTETNLLTAAVMIRPLERVMLGPELLIERN